MTDWRILNSFIYPNDAHMAKNFLESQGIEVLLKDEFTAQVNNFYSNAIGGVKLLIREDEYDRGIGVLKQGGFVVPEDEHNEVIIESVLLSSETDKNKCPFCNSKNIGKKKEPNIITMVMIIILVAFFPIFKRSHVCFDCSKEWKYAKEN